MTGRIKFFDTTLRDGEQTPGVSLNIQEKLEIARQLAKMGVDIIEAGFAIASPGDFLAVKTVAENVKGIRVASLCRAVEKDIDRAWEAVCNAESPRIHTFIATSDIHMCLSGHRRFPIGSTNPEIRQRGMDIMKKAIGFSADVGIRIIQLAAYDVFYNENSTDETKNIFYENLQKSVEWASEYGITLALETMDVDHTNSITKLMDYVRRINSPWVWRAERYTVSGSSNFNLED